MNNLTQEKIVLPPAPEKCGCGSRVFWWNGGSWTCSKCHLYPGEGKVEEVESKLIEVDARNVGPGQTAQIVEKSLVSPEAIQEIREVKEIQQLEALRARVAAGVEKLVNAWRIIQKNDNDSEFAVQSIDFFAAVNKLKGLCSQLELNGYHSCLWLHEPYPALWESRRGCDAWPDNLFCWVCPRTPADIWQNDIEKSKRLITHTEKGADVVEFLKTLGGII